MKNQKVRRSNFRSGIEASVEAQREGEVIIFLNKRSDLRSRLTKCISQSKDRVQSQLVHEYPMNIYTRGFGAIRSVQIQSSSGCLIEKANFRRTRENPTRIMGRKLRDVFHFLNDLLSSFFRFSFLFFIDNIVFPLFMYFSQEQLIVRIFLWLFCLAILQKVYAEEDASFDR